jgi:hypothetical protein
VRYAVETPTDPGTQFLRVEILWPVRRDDPYPAPDPDARWLDARLLELGSGFGKCRATPEAWPEDRPSLGGPVVVYTSAIDPHRLHDVAGLLEQARARFGREAALGELKLVDTVRLPRPPHVPTPATAADPVWR